MEKNVKHTLKAPSFHCTEASLSDLRILLEVFVGTWGKQNEVTEREKSDDLGLSLIFNYKRVLIGPHEINLS